jgi:hypothetical protein
MIAHVPGAVVFTSLVPVVPIAAGLVIELGGFDTVPEELKREVLSDVADEARRELHTQATRAARKWARDAIDIAALKGDHKPMRDLLQATGVIDSPGKPDAVSVQIIVGAGVLAARGARLEQDPQDRAALGLSEDPPSGAALLAREPFHVIDVTPLPRETE